MFLRIYFPDGALESFFLRFVLLVRQWKICHCHYVIILNNISGVIFKPILFVVSFKNIIVSSVTCWKSKVDTI